MCFFLRFLSNRESEVDSEVLSDGISLEGVSLEGDILSSGIEASLYRTTSTFDSWASLRGRVDPRSWRSGFVLGCFASLTPRSYKNNKQIAV